MKARELIKILELNNYTLLRQNKHAIFSNGTSTISIPVHNGKDMNRKLVAGILKQIKTNGLGRK
jgi:predicted RNA binding protein YcfA (HicA-like mRNA interferase family)